MLLSSYRVVDLTDERGHLAGAVLASLGAEVIHVEPPSGSPARHLGPFAGGTPDPERSLHHWAYNRGKQSVVLDLDRDEDRQRLLSLVDGADFLFDSADPGTLDALGLGRAVLAERNPALIHASITAFGSDGPKAGWHATDLTVSAASGQLVLSGDADRPPLRIPLPQAYHHAAIEAAAASLIALYERQHRSGRGQHIDCSAQQSFAQATQSMILAHPYEASIASRSAGGVRSNGVPIQLRWPCRDGYVSITFLFGAAFKDFTQRLMDWVHEEGHCDEATRSKDWETYGNVLLSDPAEVPEYQRICGTIGALLATKTKAELLAQALERRILLAPVTTIEEVRTSPQLADRDYWQVVDQGEFGPVHHPGPFARFSATPLTSLPAAPALGAHTEAVLAQPARRPDVAVTAPPGTPSSDPALAGLKVLDLQWVMAGPAGTRVLADHGAEIIRLESIHKLDTARTLQPFRRDEPDPEYSALFGNLNAGKRGLALDLSRPEARDVVFDLVDWADVVCESFSPRGMKSLGLDYDVLRQRKPDLIMTSSCLLGQTGPHAMLSGFGNMAAAISGFYNIVGWPDRAPAGAFGAYTDYVSPRFLVAAVMAAVEHRRRTGEGQYIDLSQAEATLHLLAPALLDFEVNGHILEPCGNDDPVHAPHGVYPAAGDDEWVAVACTSDEGWRSMCELLGVPELAGCTRPERLARRRHLDDVITRWTSTRTPTEVQDALQTIGVPAHQVQNSPEAFTDPQLQHRRHFLEVTHERQGTTWVEGPRFVLSRCRPAELRGAPTLGQDSFEVLTDVLGYDIERVAELAGAELLE